MSAILERIKEAYHLETDAEVADFLDINPSTLSMQKNRGRLDLNRIIEKCSDLNKNWLLDGQGEKRSFGQTNAEISIPVYQSLEIKNAEPDFESSLEAGHIYTSISNGRDKFPNSNRLIGYINPNNAMAPAINKNDIAIVDLQENPVDGAIFLLADTRSVILRRLFKNGEEIIAKSEQGTHKSINISSNGSYRLIGKLMWILRSI